MKTAKRFVRDVPGLGPILVGLPKSHHNKGNKRRRKQHKQRSRRTGRFLKG